MTTYFEQDKFTNCKVNGLLADEILISDNKIITLTRDISQDKDPSSTVRNLFLLKKEIGEIYAADTSRVTERQTFPIILAGTSQECREIENDIFKKENIYARDFKIIPRDEYYESKDKIILKDLERPNLVKINENTKLSLRTWIESKENKYIPEINFDDAIKYPKEKSHLTLPQTYEKSATAHKRLRGAPGTGKTTLLCHFAINSLKDNRNVLFTCFNMTMVNYLHSLLYQFLPNTGNLTLTHYHNYLRRVCYNEGYGPDYARIFQGRVDIDQKIDQLIKRIASNNSSLKIDTLIVDEAQDFQPEWFMQLKSLANNDVKGRYNDQKRKSHFLVAYDYGQNIYDRTPWIELNSSTYGFSGKATDTGKVDDDGVIKISYRMPYKIVQLASTFAQINLDSSETFDLPHAESANDECEIKFQDLTNLDDVVDAIIDFMGEEFSDKNQDTKTLVAIDIKELGKKIYEKLKPKTPKMINHLFHAPPYDKISKIAFSPVRRIVINNEFKLVPTKDILLSTMHSIKGWEMSSLVLVCSKGQSEKDLPGVYSMLTRIKKGDKPRLLVINMDPDNPYIGVHSTFREKIKDLLD